ncbi:hypothetical protein ANO11243_001000 [Dothideomycetidae sp. 11243]|nr:hypothetical protein ANO11243_001000 [fungal sp. No.11243]
MGDTLVYTSSPASTVASQDPLFAGAFAKTHLPAALALSATNPLNSFTSAAKMTVPQHAQPSPTRERRATEFIPPTHMRPDLPRQSVDGATQGPAILLRKLPRNIGLDGVRNLLLFAKDLANVRLVDSSPEDSGFATAVAHFNTYAGAREVRDSLDGKTNATRDAQIIVEMPHGMSPGEAAAARLGSRRSTIDGTAARTGGATTDGVSRQPSRFSSAFQSNEKISPPLVSPGGPNSLPEGSTHFQSLFSPKSPVLNSIGSDRQRNPGKSVINDDAVDDETDGLLRDPLGYARNGRPSGNMRSPMSQIPTTQFGSMSLNSGPYDGPSPLSSSNSGLASPVGGNVQHGAGGPYQGKMGHQNSFSPSAPMNGQGRTSYPPANPADQNPPCNTLYVGNLPNNTSEDELKRLFSQQRGYKRLCFRTKQNGPMCFVEFENITLATQALHHLYGKMLSNSVKGGIRLSFSKNPLGVRNGQSGIPPSMMSPHGGYSGFGGDIAPPPGFSGSNGPPPGLQSNNRGGGGGGGGGGGYNRNAVPEGMAPMYQAHQYSLSGAPFASQLRMPPSALYPDSSPPPPGPSANGNGYYDHSSR